MLGFAPSSLITATKPNALPSVRASFWFFRFSVDCFLLLRNGLLSVRLFKHVLIDVFFAFWWIFCVKCVVLFIFFVILP